MSGGGRIQRLEALLARVTKRAAEPRAHAPVRPISAVAASVSPPGGHDEIELDSAVLESARPPPIAPALPRDIAARAPTPALEEPSDSRERLVAAEPVIDDPTDAQTLPPVRPKDAPIAAALPSLDADAPDLEVGTVEVSADEAEEPPASSRRPIALEPPLEELAFGDAPPPPAPHTPPPESGRQVAAPAVDLDFEGDFTGVRPKPDEEVTKTPPRVATVPPVLAVAVAPPPAAGPEIVRPVLPQQANVAAFAGSAKEFAPSTFDELLKAALDL